MRSTSSATGRGKSWCHLRASHPEHCASLTWRRFPVEELEYRREALSMPTSLCPANGRHLQWPRGPNAERRLELVRANSIAVRRSAVSQIRRSKLETDHAQSRLHA